MSFESEGREALCLLAGGLLAGARPGLALAADKGAQNTRKYLFIPHHAKKKNAHHSRYAPPKASIALNDLNLRFYMKSADSHEACLLLTCFSAFAVFLVDMSAAAVDMSASRPLDY